MKIISLKCPECDAPVTIEEGHKQCYCKYCGAKILLDDGSTTYTYRNVDAARIREAEINGEIRLKELEIEQEEHRHKRKNNRIKVIVTIIMAVVSILFLLANSEMAQAIGFALDAAILWLWIVPFLFEDDKNRKK